MEMKHSRMIKNFMSATKRKPGMQKKKYSVRSKTDCIFSPYPTPLRKRGLCYATWHDAPHMPYCTPQGSLPDILSFLELPHPLYPFFFLWKNTVSHCFWITGYFYYFRPPFLCTFFLFFFFFQKMNSDICQSGDQKIFEESDFKHNIIYGCFRTPHSFAVT